MKRSGRTLKQRLFGLRLLPDKLGRMRYFRGHGVHSPYVYNIVRQVFMKSELCTDTPTLYLKLTQLGISRKAATQLQNLIGLCKYSSWVIDDVESTADIVLLSPQSDQSTTLSVVEQASRDGRTVVILSPSLERTRHEMCKMIVENHRSTTIDNRAYLIIFNNHLPKQHFRL